MGWDIGNAIYGGFKVGLQGGLPGLILVGPFAFVLSGFVRKEQIDAACQGSSETAHDYVHGAIMDNWP
uniref:Uncharacterized protein n=1 Tax=Panagrolaimus davidi TaxID=227884 RepID=A0A914Q5M1_9BILA